MPRWEAKKTQQVLESGLALCQTPNGLLGKILFLGFRPIRVRHGKTCEIFFPILKDADLGTDNPEQVIEMLGELILRLLYLRQMNQTFLD